MAFPFFSGHGYSFEVQYCAKLFCQLKPGSTALGKLFNFYLVMAVGNVMLEAAIVYGYEEAAIFFAFLHRFKSYCKKQ